MCNLYRQDVAQSKIIHFFEGSGLSLSDAARGKNIEPGFVGADQDGPVLINGKNGLDIVTKRWGFPPIREKARPITNIRNLKSSWWRGVSRKLNIDASFLFPHSQSGIARQREMPGSR